MENLWVLVAGVVGLVGGYFIARAILRAQQSGSSELLQAKTQEAEEIRKQLSEVQSDRAKFEERAGRVGALESERSELTAKIAQLSTHVATLESEKKNLEETKKFLEEAEKELKEAFLAASTTALEKNNARFLELANERFNALKKESAGDLEQRKQAIDQLVKPINEALAGYQKKIEEIEKSRIDSTATVTEQIRALGDLQKGLHNQTQNLVQALRNPATRGRWGEMHLKNVVRMAGLIEYCDFTEQVSVTTEDVRQRPDLIVRLPNNQQIVVDAKAPTSTYLDAMEMEEEGARAERLKHHAVLIRQHVQKLSSKSYWQAFESAEFVVLFLPLESEYSSALHQDPELIEFGAKNNVIIATPTTLIALLKAVAYGWRQEQLAQSAKEVSELGKSLYESIRTMAGNFQRVGRNLDTAVKSYNDTVGSLEARVLPRARRFHETKVAVGEEVAQLEPVVGNVRNLASADWPALLPATEDVPLKALVSDEPVEETIES
ncbi:MAG: DNA recombination protein RmuC [Fimbriimonadaceae bacterium]|nr:DNA recombination protein RmuC [Fimbriimonadaceae bacterium]